MSHRFFPAGAGQITRRRTLYYTLFPVLFFALVALTVPAKAQDTPPAATHTVRAGETLSEIAESFGLPEQMLLDYNGLQDADAIFEGQTLRIPGADAPIPAGMVRVAAGETLSGIAKRAGVELEALMEANKIEDANALYAGQLLRLPGVLAESTAAATAASTPAPDSTATTATPEPVPAGTVLVAEGETLSGIAKRLGVELEALMETNAITDANEVYAGQLLRLPGVSPEPTMAPTATATAPAATPESAPGVYVVQPGDTLTGIAKRFGLVADDVRALNDLSDQDFIAVGQRLQLVAPTPTTAPTETPTEPAATPVSTVVTATVVTSPTPAPIRPPAPVTHTVEAGETLSGIASRYGLTLEQLKTINGIEDENAIYSGQELLLVAPTPTVTPTPAAPLESETMTPTATATTPAAAVLDLTLPTTHTVGAGETLSGIARRYDLTLEQLKANNGIGDENAIYSGQELLLVAPTPTPTPEATSTATVPPTPELSVATPAPTIDPAMIERSGNPIGSLNSTYTVRPGDTLSWIAVRLGIDQAALQHLNGFTDENAPLNAGQTLLLPASGDDLLPRTPAQTYEVQPGESLSAIAQAFDSTIYEILRANRIADANAIYPGQRLIIPSRTLESGATREIGPARGGYFYYTVQPGDTLGTLASQFGSTLLALQDYNDLPDNETVYNGMELRIPFGAPPLPLRTPPAPASSHRFVVSLSRQQCWVYEGERMLYSWNCSTGYGEWKTKKGNYAVQSKILNAKSFAWRLDMPYWLGIYDVGQYENGIHGLPVDWDTGKKIWTTLVGQPATFGCAMLGDDNASMLYKLAYIGMPVYVID